MKPDPPIPVTEIDLHAFVDGQLAPERAAEVEAWLAQHPEERAEVEGWRKQNEAIRGLFPAADPSLPATLPRRRRSAAASLIRIAASLALFVGGLGAGVALERGWTASDSGDGGLRIAEAGRINHVVYASEIRHPVEVAADQEAHLVTWLGNRLGGALTAPDLSSRGFRLVGGRLVTFAGGPGALLMYEDDGGARLTLLVGRNEDGSETGFRFSRAGAVNTFHWIDGPFGYALSGSVPRDRLSAAVHEVHRQIGEGQTG